MWKILVIQSKSQWNINLHPFELMSKKKKKREMTSIGEPVEKREHLYTGKNINWCNHYINILEVPQKIKNRDTVWSSNSASGYLFEEDENTNLNRYM